jgi:FdhD protein
MAVMTTRRRVLRLDVAGSLTPRGDELAVEAPLNLVVSGDVVATLMRTPGHNLELAAGWLTVESGVGSSSDLIVLRQCRTEDDVLARSLDTHAGRGVDQVHLTLADGVRAPRPRAWLTGSACGVCSADVLDLAILRRAEPRTPGWMVPADVVRDLPRALRARQRAFDRTGSLHAAALATPAGDLVVVREDVGRHNAVDKVTGWALLNDRLPALDHLLVVSGRVSFEIVQKAVAAGVAGIVAVSAPSDLAVDLAREFDLVLVGMIREGRMNVYAGDAYLAGR